MASIYFILCCKRWPWAPLPQIFALFEMLLCPPFFLLLSFCQESLSIGWLHAWIKVRKTHQRTKHSQFMFFIFFPSFRYACINWRPYPDWSWKTTRIYHKKRLQATAEKILCCLCCGRNPVFSYFIQSWTKARSFTNGRWFFHKWQWFFSQLSSMKVKLLGKKVIFCLVVYSNVFETSIY